jgi:hypothetical protein
MSRQELEAHVLRYLSVAGSVELSAVRREIGGGTVPELRAALKRVGCRVVKSRNAWPTLSVPDGKYLGDCNLFPRRIVTWYVYENGGQS